MISPLVATQASTPIASIQQNADAQSILHSQNALHETQEQEREVRETVVQKEEAAYYEQSPDAKEEGKNKYQNLYSEKMSTTVIVLIVIGLIFIFVSFALSEKLSEEKEESAGVVKIPKELTQEQKEKIDTLIRDYMDQQVDGKLADIETRLAEIVNQKTLALGDYAVSVNEEIDRNHKEVVFLYDMLSDKQKEIMTTVNMIDEYKKEIALMVQEQAAQNIVRDSQNVQTPVAEPETQEPVQPEEQPETDADLDDAIRDLEETPLPEEAREELENVDNKDMILEMHKAGLSILEIAKHLGLGVGEVKLVVDLYQGEAK